ncbi:unnamed protein product, partial [Brachionus calyciflorus]
CRLKSFCKPYGKLTKINPAYQLILDSNCTEGCEKSIETHFQHKIYYSLENDEENWILFNKTLLEMCTIGETEQEFTILPKIFSSNTNILYWKVELEVKAIFPDQTSSIGSTSMHFKINEKPFNGNCTINSTRGYALKTLFAIECSSWTDNDGYIVRYEYFAKYSDGSSPIAIFFNSEGVLITQLPQGLKEDFYRLYIFIQIFDDLDAITVFEIPEPVIVEVDMKFFESIVNPILNDPISFDLLKEIRTGDLNVASKNIISMTSILNDAPLDIEKKKQIKILFVDEITKYNANDMSSVKLISSVLSIISKKTADIDMESANKILNKIKELSNNLVELSNYNGFDFLKQASDNIIDVTGNVLESFILFNSSNLLTNYKISNSILNDLVNMSSRHLSLNLETKTRSKNIDFIISRQKGNNLKDKIIELNDGQVKLPSYNNSNILLLKSFSIPQIINGNSEHLKNSHMISLSYFDKDAQGLKITNSNENYFEIK